MLQALKARNHWLAVATGKSRRGLDEALAHAQLRGLFDGTRTADETASKPHPLMLLELMGELGVEPERTLMIGDTTHDLQLAANAGAARVGVSYGAHEHEAFAALRAAVRRPLARASCTTGCCDMPERDARRRREPLCASARAGRARPGAASSTCCSTASRCGPSRCASTAAWSPT